MKKIYISGKMGESPLSDETIVKFQRAEKYLKSQGWNVSNPASDEYQEGLKSCLEKYSRRYGEPTPKQEYETVLMTDIVTLSLCDAIYMLPDWKDSPGATAEYYYAKAVGKEIIMGQVKDILDHEYDLVKLGASTRLLNCLKLGPYEIENLEEVTLLTKDDLLRIRGFGLATLDELDKLMEENGFEYRKDY